MIQKRRVRAGSLTLVGGRDKVCDERDDKVRGKVLEHLRGKDGLGHLGSGDGRDAVDQDAVLGTLDSQGLAESHLGELCGRVVGLTEVAIKAGSRGSVDDATVLGAANAEERHRDQREIGETASQNVGAFPGFLSRDETAHLLLAHVRPCGLGAVEATLDVNGHDIVPLLVGHGLHSVGAWQLGL